MLKNSDIPIEWLSKEFQGLCGYINKEGDMAIDPVFNYGGSFSEGLACVMRPSETEREYEFINIYGETIIESAGISEFHDGLALMKNLSCYIDKNGNAAIDFNRFYNPNSKGSAVYAYFNEGVAEFPVWDDDKESYVYTYIDTTGEPIFDKTFDIAYPFSEGRAIVWKDGNMGCINKEGEFIFWNNNIWGYSERYSEGCIIFDDGAEYPDAKCGFLDREGNVVILPVYDNVYKGFTNGLALVEINGEMAYIDHDNNVIIAFEEPDVCFWW